VTRSFGADLGGAAAAALAAPPDARIAPGFDEVYAAHAAFVWRTVRALGVAPAHVDDAVQDVFVVVHQKLGEFRGPARLETWLFAIARRVASHYRRAAGRARTEALDAIDETAAIASAAGTFEEASRREAAALLTAILAELDDDKRELLVLVELDQVPVPEVATYLGVPLNTAYSRVRLARRAFEAALARRRGEPEGGRR
jgi:RNA polymerase sigma-70 factor (ECF subfamily)